MATQQFVAAAGGQFLQVFAEHAHQFEATQQGRFVGGETGRNAGHVLVHQLLQAEQTLTGRQVIGVHVGIGGSVLIRLEGYHGRPYLLLEPVNLTIVDLGQGLVVKGVGHGGFTGQAPFGKRS